MKIINLLKRSHLVIFTSTKMSYLNRKILLRLMKINLREFKRRMFRSIKSKMKGERSECLILKIFLMLKNLISSKTTNLIKICRLFLKNQNLIWGTIMREKFKMVFPMVMEWKECPMVLSIKVILNWGRNLGRENLKNQESIFIKVIL